MTAPVLNIHSVTPWGAVSLLMANIPYTNLQWNRSRSAPGRFSVQLSCPMPVEWPGRYLVTVDGFVEVGIIEKVESADDGSTTPTLSGRFAECMWSRYRLGAGGQQVSGANWRQAVTAAMSAWHMDDMPPLDMDSGTEQPTGGSYVVSGDAGNSASELIYSVCNDNSAHPLVTYDRDGNPGRLIVRIVDELDRTSGQTDRPPKIFSLAMGSALSVSYSGDYSTACSEIVAHLEKTVDQVEYDITQNVAVSSFDPETCWKQRAYEDVSSLVADDVVPTASSVQEAGRLRTYDHDAALEVDSSVTASGYLDDWDLGDLCEAEVASLSLTAQERVEEVNVTIKPEGMTVEPVLGTKYLSRISRAMINRR